MIRGGPISKGAIAALVVQCPAFGCPKSTAGAIAESCGPKINLNLGSQNGFQSCCWMQNHDLTYGVQGAFRYGSCHLLPAAKAKGSMQRYGIYINSKV